MCTVTFIPQGNRVLITSNRDEKATRKLALKPQISQQDDIYILYPKDGQAGGSWIGASSTGSVMVLLNGGFIKHEPAAAYRRSRGLIFTDILASGHALNTYRTINLIGIEPFTLIIWEQQRLHECRWSGEEKYIREMDAAQPHIWSSVTLYASEIIQQREQWFREWMFKHPKPAPEEVLEFHLFGGKGDQQNDIRMNRDNDMLTVSVTRLVCLNQSITMHYHDLLQQKIYQEAMPYSQQPVI